MSKIWKLNGIGLAILAGAVASIAGATNGMAHDPGHLRIENKSPYWITYYVNNNDNWNNCNDQPQSGFYVANVAPNSTSAYFEFLRTDGHGCNGKQGQFGMTPSMPAYAAQEQQFSYDSHGAMGLAGPNPNYASQFIDEGNNNYKWVVSPTNK